MEAVATKNLTDKHLPTIQRAIRALEERTFYSAWPEHPKPYGEDAPGKGLESYKAFLGNQFDRLLQDGESGWVGEEVSPYTQEQLDVEYPLYSVDALISNATNAATTWSKASVYRMPGSRSWVGSATNPGTLAS